MTTVQTGGKLYIAGEYSVLTPGQTAIIKNIPIYMTATVTDAEQISIMSDMFDYQVNMSPDNNYALIQESVRTLETFHGQPLSSFSLVITGKLEKDSLKFGIGSSGSVTVLTIKALAQHFDIPLTVDELFKLSAYTLLKRGDNGSMGDIACIAYDDLVAYTSFNREKIADQISVKSLFELMAMDWGYTIERLTPRIHADFLVGWTRQPAISKDMINQVKSVITLDYLNQTQVAVLKTKEALQTGNHNLLKMSLQTVSDLLLSLSSAIYIDKLKALKESENGLDAITKSSGSGGGDCGIAYSFSKKDSELLIERWASVGIELLHQERNL
ncbi:MULTISPECIES: phosphomevalonate kinase [Streptococcus]|uniref:phosphomevalonate kinase n=1 Tax=Streptococcus caledonicus TaxID=2614158 RepID=A0ABW0UF55_9STRE|nr:phosphomevalonate kinase [Streptococcus sp. S784/96/1]